MKYLKQHLAVHAKKEAAAAAAAPAGDAAATAGAAAALGEDDDDDASVEEEEEDEEERSRVGNKSVDRDESSGKPRKSYGCGVCLCDVWTTRDGGRMLQGTQVRTSHIIGIWIYNLQLHHLHDLPSQLLIQC